MSSTACLARTWDEVEEVIKVVVALAGEIAVDAAGAAVNVGTAVGSTEHLAQTWKEVAEVAEAAVDAGTAVIVGTDVDAAGTAVDGGTGDAEAAVSAARCLAHHLAPSRRLCESNSREREHTPLRRKPSPT